MAGKIAIVGDLHFGIRITDERYLQYQLEEWIKFLDYCDANGINRLIGLGDFFDNRNHLSVKMLDMVKNKMLKNNMKSILLVGNHDTLYKNTTRVNSPKLVFEKHDNIRVIDNPCHLTIAGTKCLFLPWITDENFKQVRAAIKGSDAKICFGHLELNGFQMVNGIECKNGLSAGLFKKFDRVYTGHFHLVQSLANIHYLGAFYQTTWADCGDQKFIYVVDNDLINLDKVPLVRPIFKKFYLSEENPIRECDVDNATDSYVKIYLSYKMKAKDEKLLSKLQNNAIKADVVDMRLMLDAPDDADVIDEDFIDIFNGYMEIQDTVVDPELIEGVSTLIKTTYAEAIKC